MTKDDKPWQDEEWLRTKSIDEGLSSGDIAREYDISPKGVRYWMKKFDIPRRSMTRIELSPDEIRRLYWDEELSTYQIGDEIGCSRKTVCNFMDRHGIEKRGLSSSISLGMGGDGSGVTYKLNKKGHQIWSTMIEEGVCRSAQVHRLIVVAEYGLGAIKGKHIHHANHCSWDNRIENLEVLDESEHLSYHAGIRAGNDEVPWEKFDAYDGFSKEDKKVKVVQ